MKRLFLSLALIAAGSTVFAQQQPKTPPPPPLPAGAQEPPRPPGRTLTSLALGADIPNAGMMLHAFDGQQTSMEQAKTDKGLLVMFSCNTCPYVIKAQPKTIEAMNMAKKLDIGMVILNSNEAQRTKEDGPKQMQAYAAEQKYTVPYVMDDASQMADAFGATRTPEVYLFDGKGKLVYKGALEDNPAEPKKSKQSYAVEAMKNMVAGKPIKPAETKSIGCGIKRIDM